jgi:uncharacterized repeat protein (TIGR03803 family)
VLYKFTGGTDGGRPQSPLLLQNGQLVGITPLGGGAKYPSGYGTIFAIGGHANPETTLYTFVGQNGSTSAYAGLVGDSAGNLYGVTPSGGDNNEGMVFMERSTGEMIVLHSFAGSDGELPSSSLTLDSTGNLYGATEAGGARGIGTVFKLQPDGTLITLHSFHGGQDGRSPFSGLLLEKGELYGTTEVGGSHHSGTVFRVNANTGKETVLYQFTGGSDGQGPMAANLVGDGVGNIYGTTPGGGTVSTGRPKGGGVVFALNIATGQESVLHSFAGPDGIIPSGNVVRDQQGNLYGTALGGGTNGRGTIFKLGSTGTFTVLHNFTGKEDGSQPLGGLVISHTGTIYGTTREGGSEGCSCGTVFELTP